MPKTPPISPGGGGLISTSNPSREGPQEIASLLARAPVVRCACDLDLLLFLYRHPRALLTSDQLAAFIGYDIKQVAASLEAFIDSGLLERTQNPMHAARMYVLVLDGPQGGDLTDILKLASTRQGRHDILRALPPARPRTDSGPVQGKRRLLQIA